MLTLSGRKTRDEEREKGGGRRSRSGPRRMSEKVFVIVAPTRQFWQCRRRNLTVDRRAENAGVTECGMCSLLSSYSAIRIIVLKIRIKEGRVGDH